MIGALTQGDRRATAGADLTEFNFDTVYGRNALKTMYNSILYVSIIVTLWVLFNGNGMDMKIKYGLSH